ncbi:MAG: response regulator [bacterium]
MKILLADENIDRRFKLKLIFRKFDCQFLEARNFDTLLKFLSDEKPRICLIDYFLSGSAQMSIYDICREITSKFSIPVIVLLPREIEVSNVAPATKYLTFPETDEAKENLIRSAEQMLGSPLPVKEIDENVGRKKLRKIIIADDDNTIRILLKTLLKDYDTEEAVNGLELKEKVPVFNPDLVITDIIMPGVSGWKAIREIKENPEFKNMPVIFASGYVKDKEIYEMHRPAGPTAFLLKPFKKAQLFDILRKFFILTE